jgi:hypothetical protein
VEAWKAAADLRAEVRAAMQGNGARGPVTYVAVHGRAVPLPPATPLSYRS